MPEYGRFLSTDPLWGEFPQTSTYVYADNEPITKKDPSGAIWETIWDVANVVVDAGRVAYHAVKGNKEAAKEAAVDLAFDVAATIVPGLPAGLNKLRHADEAVDAAKTADKVVDASKAGKKTTEGAEQVGKGSKTSIHVTRDGVALPPGQKHHIPKGYVENPNRNGSYGVIVNGKFVEKLRIDPATQPGKKGPSYSHYHLDGKSTHYSPRPGSKDPGFTPKPPENK